MGKPPTDEELAIVKKNAEEYLAKKATKKTKAAIAFAPTVAENTEDASQEEDEEGSSVTNPETEDMPVENAAPSPPVQLPQLAPQPMSDINRAIFEEFGNAAAGYIYDKSPAGKATKKMKKRGFVEIGHLDDELKEAADNEYYCCKRENASKPKLSCGECTMQVFATHDLFLKHLSEKKKSKRAAQQEVSNVVEQEHENSGGHAAPEPVQTKKKKKTKHSAALLDD
jgi:hypothetical protein